uniref:Sodium/hydrogen exchanger n=2 Tax=Steinernema glaseri TaxID=37863 RepID=A0A1I7ZV99_9BILA
MMNYIPESALQLAIGLVFGTVFHFLDPSQEVYLRPDWFFLYLLPPIVLDAGFFLSNKDFFPNAGTIMVYAVFGTLWNIVMIALTLYGCSDYFSVKTSFIDLCLFATLISAVDPVAVIGVFERLHVNALLHICVFGESLLNDVVTVVLYKTLIVLSEVGTENMNTVDYVTSAVSFIFVSAEGIVFGALSGLLTSLATKYAQIDPLQPLILLLLPYLSYLISEGFGQSGILTIAVCGVVMRQYVLGNMDNSSQIASANCFKMLSSCCEAMIFVFLGVSVISANHYFDPVFVVVTVVSCLVYRFMGVGILTFLVNKRRVNRISGVNQFIMGYGGLRGAICYGLVMSIDENIIPYKKMFFTTTIAVILSTVFIQGLTIKPIVKCLHVRLDDPRKKILLESIHEQVNNDLMAGIEVLAGYRGLHRIRKIFEGYNDRYVKKYLMIEQATPAKRLVKKFENIQLNEAAKLIRAHGSFAGMPTVSSQAVIALPSSRSEIIGFGTSIEMEPSRPTPPDMPRNQSLSVLLQNEFAKVNGPEHGPYSRHFLDYETSGVSPITYAALDKKSEEELSHEGHYQTYPYSRDRQVESLLSTVRKASRGALEKEQPKIPKCTDIFPSTSGVVSSWTKPEKPKFSIGTEDVEISIPTQKVSFKVGTSKDRGTEKGRSDEKRSLMPIDEEASDTEDISSSSTM